MFERMLVLSLCLMSMACISKQKVHILHGLQRLLDASVPLPQELIQAQKGLAKQAQRTPLPLRPREDAAAADQENSGAGQAGRGPAKAVKTRHRMAMQDSGEPVCAASPCCDSLPADMTQARQHGHC